MNSINYEVDETQTQTVSVFLIMILEYASDIGLWQLLREENKRQDESSDL